MNRQDDRDRLYGVTAGKVSVAYDMSVFDTRNKGKGLHNVTSIVNKRRRQEARRTLFRDACICLFVVFMLAGIVLSSTQLTELTAQAASLKSRHEELLSEQKKLQAILDMRTNLKEVESIATDELYMQKLEQDQIVYVHLTGSDHGEVVEDDRSLAVRTIDMLKSAALKLGEYVN
ncbi:MAG TPA: hypothetical protein VN446_06350 [Candidatus Acidoferrum sp.]|nr:hypothetical protein [Candidatus Acidoferrum sp.]